MREAEADPRGVADEAEPDERERELAALRRELLRTRRERDEALEEQRRAVRDQLTFLALVAHQLKGPILPLDVSLRTIQRSLERGRELPPDTIRRTLRQSRRLARLIDALLVDLPRADEGSLTVSVSKVDLMSPVRAAVEELALLVESRTFELCSPEGPICVLADSERIACIVSSLLDNAIKYSPPGAAVRIEVVAQPREAMVSVVDHGIGIPAIEMGQIFSKFFRASNAPSHLYRGLGVGLYLSRKFAELCHGRLLVESKEGAGTRSTLVLPLAAA
jgi:signal transduction histidine kinase